MDKKLVVRVFDTAGKMRGLHRLFDPLVESGYTTEQVEEVVSFCLENDLHDKSLYRPGFGSGPTDEGERWGMGVSIKGFEALEELERVGGSREDLRL
ncbi:MAG: hypothetical protein OXO48_05265 [Caldilineaceae bacterium]|nr:hypothetical protein [Caldilineaceae bacterium]